MKKLYISIIAVFFCYGAFAQLPNLALGAKIGGDNDDYITSVATDGAGNVYVAGYFTGFADLEEFSGSTTITGNGGIDGYVAKYNTAGNLVWINVIGGASNDAVSSIAADANGVYVTGFFQSTVDFDPTVGSAPRSTTGGSSDVFVAKYNPTNGALTWVNTFGSSDVDYGNTIAIDGNSNVYVGAAFNDLVNPDPLADDLNSQASTGGYDMLIVNYNSDGSLSWSHKIGSTTDDVPNAIVVSDDGVFVGGSYTGLLYVDQTDASLTISNLGDTDGYVGQYEPSLGTFIKGHSIRSTGADLVQSLKIDNGYVYSTGTFSDDASMFGDNGTSLSVTSNGAVDAFISKHDISSDELQWLYAYGGTDNDYANSITTEGANVYVVGTFSGTVDVDPTSSTVSLNSAGSFDAYMLKITRDGNYVASGKAGGTLDDEASSVVIANGNLVWTGIFQGSSVDIDPGTTSLLKTATGGFDGFVGVFNPSEPTSSAGDIEFSSIDDTSFEITYTGASPRPDGYLVIGRVGATTTSAVPVDGVNYTAGDDIGSDFVQYVGPEDDIAYFDGTAGTKYNFTVYPYNGSGTNINYKTTSPATNNVTTTGGVADTTAPVINDQSPSTAPINTDVKLTVKVTDAESGVATVSIDYYPINSVRQGTDDLTLKSGTTDTYEVTVPKGYNTQQGIEYQITAVDNAGNSKQTDFRSIIVEYTDAGLQVDYQAGTDQANYRIIAIPLDLKKASVNDVFDELGAYDKTKYRLFQFNGTTSSELSGSSSITIGKGYWFIAADTKTVMSGAGTTASVGASNPYSIRISNGWNLIGNPFNHDIDWDIITGTDDNSDKTLNKFKIFEGSFADGSTLKALHGGFVMVAVAGDGNLTIPVVIDNTGRKAAPAPVNFAQNIDSDTWGVNFIMKSGGQQNIFAGFGMHPDADDQYDRFDDYTLPRFLDYLELNYNKTLHGSAFTKDIVPTSGQHVWEFKVASNVFDDIVELAWDNSYFGHTDLQLVLWDVDQQRAVDMKLNNKYSFERSKSGSFKIFYGSESFVKTETLPNTPVFHTAYPVPSSGNVTFAFSVPESDGQVNTNLSIYNSLGQKVAKLVDQPLAAGYQQAVWNIEDGSKPAVGVYISVLKFGDLTLHKRLVIK